MSLGHLISCAKKTLTCYNGIIGDGCGECPACKLRAAGLAEYVAERKRSGRIMDNFFGFRIVENLQKNRQGYSS
ncbi:hypothetical protein GCM10020331_072530 [Ectobacillus funiculus]